MPIRFHVLASGSSGNACILEVGDTCILIDFGIPARTLTRRLERRGLAWERVAAALLSHTHGDHWQASTLTQLVQHRIPLFCHAEHAAALANASSAYADLASAGLVRFYEAGQRVSIHADCDCVPIALSHDAEPTSGFRFEGRSVLLGEQSWALGYAADLGCWTPELVRHFAEVDLIGLEFNHDVRMQMTSRRPPLLIRRVLGDAGHLSNEQAAAFLAEVVAQSPAGRLQAVVQLHLSQQCNRPELARTAAEDVIARLNVDVAVHTAVQGRIGPSVTLGECTPPKRRRVVRARVPEWVQPLLPFGADV